MTISTELVCPEQTNQMVKCSYDNIEGSICVRKDCKNSSVSSCNCVNGLCSWSVGEPSEFRKSENYLIPVKSARHGEAAAWTAFARAATKLIGNLTKILFGKKII